MTSNLPQVPEEIELAKQQDRHQFELAIRSLELSNENDRGFYEAFKTDRRQKFWLSMTALVLFFGILGASILLNKDGLAMELIKMVATFAGGGGLGYALGAHKSQRRQSQD